MRNFLTDLCCAAIFAATIASPFIIYFGLFMTP